MGNQTATVQETKSTTRTSLEKALIVVPLIISSFSIGLSFIFAYTGVLQQKTVTTEDNEIVIRRPLSPPYINSARLNLTLNDWDTIYFKRQDTTMGSLDPSENYFQNGEAVWTGRSPLAVKLSNSAPETRTFPARLITLETYDGNGGIDNYTLCVPQNELPAGSQTNFFFDTTGTPYSDSPLTHRVTSSACNQLLAHALTPQEINSARLNNTVPDWDDSLAFTREGTLMAWLNSATNTFLYVGRVWTGRSPLMLEISNIMADPRIFPARLITLDTFVNGDSASYTLCFPESEVPGLANNSAGKVSYFYDTTGTPYTDSFLTQRVTCTVKEVTSE